jgi:hypothetical protein
METRNWRSFFFIFGLLILLSACSFIRHQHEVIIPTQTLSPCTSRANFEDPADAQYKLPFPVGRSYRISQTYCFPESSHSIQLVYDFDILIADFGVSFLEGHLK